MIGTEWAIAIIVFIFLALAVFGSIASKFLPSTPAIRFCNRLWTWFKKIHQATAMSIMIVMLLLLLIFSIDKLLR
jgi:hypothetical protein